MKPKGVLLVSLGSDYNVFAVGRIWEEAWPGHQRVPSPARRPPELSDASR